MADRRLRLIIEAQNKAQAAFAQVEGNLQKLNARVVASNKSFEDSFGQLSSKLQSTGQAMTIGVTAPLALLGKAAFTAYAQFDSLERGMIAVTGSSAAARSEFVKLREIAKLPGLGFKESLQGSINLQSAGASANEARKYLMAFGNALATVGKGKNELDMVNLALTQLMNRTSGFGQEIRQLQEHLPQIRQMMIKAFGTADSEVIGKMGITGKQFVDKIAIELAKLPAMMGGPKNAIENLADAWFIALNTIGKAMSPVVTKVIDDLTSLATSIQIVNPSVIEFGIVVGVIAAGAGPLMMFASGLTQTIYLLKSMKTASLTAAAATEVLTTAETARAVAAKASAYIAPTLYTLPSASYTAPVLYNLPTMETGAAAAAGAGAAGGLAKLKALIPILAALAGPLAIVAAAVAAIAIGMDRINKKDYDAANKSEADYQKMAAKAEKSGMVQTDNGGWMTSQAAYRAQKLKNNLSPETLEKTKEAEAAANRSTAMYKELEGATAATETEIRARAQFNETYAKLEEEYKNGQAVQERLNEAYAIYNYTVNKATTEKDKANKKEEDAADRSRGMYQELSAATGIAELEVKARYDFNETYVELEEAYKNGEVVTARLANAYTKYQYELATVYKEMAKQEKIAQANADMINATIGLTASAAMLTTAQYEYNNTYNQLAEEYKGGAAVQSRLNEAYAKFSKAAYEASKAQKRESWAEYGKNVEAQLLGLDILDTLTSKYQSAIARSELELRTALALAETQGDINIAWAKYYKALSDGKRAREKDANDNLQNETQAYYESNALVAESPTNFNDPLGATQWRNLAKYKSTVKQLDELQKLGYDVTQRRQLAENQFISDDNKAYLNYAQTVGDKIKLYRKDADEYVLNLQRQIAADQERERRRIKWTNSDSLWKDANVQGAAARFNSSVPFFQLRDNGSDPTQQEIADATNDVVGNTNRIADVMIQIADYLRNGQPEGAAF